jgi:hypothetical protein
MNVINVNPWNNDFNEVKNKEIVFFERCGTIHINLFFLFLSYATRVSTLIGSQDTAAQKKVLQAQAFFREIRQKTFTFLYSYESDNFIRCFRNDGYKATRF